jgi:hypothetical protein
LTLLRQTVIVTDTYRHAHTQTYAQGVQNDDNI